MILALDLGSKMGYAYDHEGSTTSGMEDFAPAKTRKFDGGGVRFLRFDQWLRSLPLPEYVVFEAVRRHKGVDAAHVYGGWLAVLTKFCEENGVPYESRTVQDIKMFATGKGNAGKGALIAAAQARGLTATDDNEVDAWWLLQLVLYERMMS